MNAQEILRQYFGYTEFREGQSAVIDHTLGGGDVLGIMPTGAGKSVCYQIPALMLPGITLVVSPLISLMMDQVRALIQLGIKAAYINSTLSPAQSREALRRAALGAYKIIYVAPERLATPAFLEMVDQVEIAMVTVDEAHCVSQWGQDFRPSYLQIAAFVARFAKRPIVGAYTATATPRVQEDIVHMLSLRKPHVMRTGFDRKNLFFEVLKPKDKMQELMHILGRREGKCGIVYCATRKNVESVTEALRAYGIQAAAYHAGMPDDQRQRNQEDFLYDRVTVMVATNAFGMGIDKSNVAFVVHYNMPKNIEGYYQEAGRAGRDGSPADCILLYSKQDVRMHQFMIDRNAEANEQTMTPEEASAVRGNDLELLRRMTFYCTTARCLREFILAYFGETAPKRCDGCGTCTPRAVELAPALRRQAKAKAPSDSAQKELFAILQQVRRNIAEEQHVPAYIVFSDAALREMCQRLPTDGRAFLDVPGVGQTKLVRYGDAFLRAIHDYVQQRMATHHS